MRKGSKMTLEQRKRVSDGHKGQIAWSKGLTKNDDERIKKLSEKIKIANAEGRCGMSGKKHSKETKLKMSASSKTKELWKNPQYRKMMVDKHIDFYQKHPEKHPNRIQRRNRMTYIENQIKNVLIHSLKLKDKKDFEHNHRIKRYFVDFAIFSKRLVIECDGEHWHRDKEKDLERQKEIEKENWNVIRFTGKEIQNNLSKCKMKIYAELYGDIEKQEIKSSCDNIIGIPQ